MKKLVVLGLISLLAACTSIDELKSTKTYTPKIKREGSVNVAARATGIKTNKVGNTTILAVPIGRIETDSDASASMMKSVEQALQSAGYNSQGNSAFNSADAGYLKMHVESMRFGNWLFSSWGTIIVHLRLETRDGGLLWKKRIRTKVNRVTNYDNTAIVAMNKLVKDMTNAFGKNDFYQASKRVKRHNDFLKEGTEQADSEVTATATES